MSLTDACAWSGLRGIVITAVVVPLAGGVAALLMTSSPRPRKLLIGLLSVTFLFPELATGYAYRNFSLSLVHYPRLNELFYAVLLIVKCLPAGTLMLRFAPNSPISAEALHCRRLALAREESFWRRAAILLDWRLRGPARTLLPACAVVFLLAFQEFEMASLLQATAWTVHLFDEHATGLPLAESLRRTMIPATVQLVVVAAVLALMARGRGVFSSEHQQRRRVPRGQAGFLWLFLLGGFTLMAVVPCVMLGTQVGDGVQALWNNRLVRDGFLQDVARGAAVAVLAGVAAWAAARWWHDTPAKRRHLAGWLTAGGLFSAPGLMGSLVLSLALLALFQRPVLRLFYQPPLHFEFLGLVPWWAGQLLYLAPRALLLVVLLGTLRRRESLHLAQMMEAAPSRRLSRAGSLIRWDYETARHAGVVLLLAYWAYLDLTVVSILGPAGMGNATLELYRQMHFGRNNVLAAMVGIVVCVPLCLLVSASAVRRIVFAGGRA